jgi:putative ABC transport system permease protein
MLQGIFTNQLALGCAQAAATTVLALLVMLLARQCEIHLERETVVALMRGIVQIIAVGSIFLMLLRGPAWTSVLLLVAMIVAGVVNLSKTKPTQGGEIRRIGSLHVLCC